MRVTCAISGIRFSSSYFEDITIQHTEGYFHPIFAVPYKSLHKLYSSHCRGELNYNDSYLLFLAFLHSSGKISWKHPASLQPNNSNTRALIENNMAQLIGVLEKSALIQHPSFRQPDFSVTYETSFLQQIPNWIEAWENNIKSFQSGVANAKERQTLVEVENKLSVLILSGEDPKKFAHIIANWASLAGEFPPDKDELYKKTIRSCFSIAKMFNTDIYLLKEIKAHCEANIDVGSIHFHTLCTVLKEGISRHHDYLGGSVLATGYTMLPTLSELAATHTPEELKAKKAKEAENEAFLLSQVETSTLEPPQQADYPDSLDFLKAKLAHRMAKNAEMKELREIIDSNKTDNIGDAL